MVYSYHLLYLWYSPRETTRVDRYSLNQAGDTTLYLDGPAAGWARLAAGVLCIRNQRHTVYSGWMCLVYTVYTCACFMCMELLVGFALLLGWYISLPVYVLMVGSGKKLWANVCREMTLPLERLIPRLGTSWPSMPFWFAPELTTSSHACCMASTMASTSIFLGLLYCSYSF